jgi:SAM-dependent methyltransferase
MPSHDKPQASSETKASQLNEEIYGENVDFWARAWGGVKTPYTQMPKLSYLPDIPDNLEGYGCKQILDLGCGSGWLSVYLARRGFAVTGVDIAPQAIELAKMWASEEKLAIDFSVKDILQMDFAEGSFDACVANAIFEHLTLELAETCLKRVHKFLKPGGIFVGCFDKVGGGPGEYFELDDGTHIYTDKGRKGMLLRCFDDDELKTLFTGWTIESFETAENGTRIIWARRP